MSNATFQHRHYALVAALLNETRDEHGNAVINNLADSFADMFTKDNVRFDRARFLAACYGNPTRKDRRSGERQRGLPLSP